MRTKEKGLNTVNSEQRAFLNFPTANLSLKKINLTVKKIGRKY